MSMNFQTDMKSMYIYVQDMEVSLQAKMLPGK